MLPTIFNNLPLEFREHMPSCPSCRKLSGQGVTPYPTKWPRWSNLEIFCCMHCGFGYVPEVTFSLDLYYQEEYGADHGRIRYPKPEELFSQIEDSEERFARRACRQATVLADFGAGRGRVLDVGAGVGSLLSQMPADQRFAIEGDAVSASYLDHLGVTRLGFEVLGTETFDTITASHFVEHLMVPGLEWFLAAVAGSLSAGGHLMIEVPELGHVVHRKVPDVGHIPHTLFFSERSLIAFVQRSGFRIRHCSNHGRVYGVKDDGEVVLRKIVGRESRATSLLVVAERTAHPAAAVEVRSSPPVVERPRPLRRRIYRKARKLARNPRRFFADMISLGR